MVKLQAHDPEHIKGWQEICDVSKKEFKKVKQNITGIIEKQECTLEIMLPVGGELPCLNIME